MQDLLFSHFKAEDQLLDISYFGADNCSLTIKREDLVHSQVSGNKFRKLKYNIKEAIEVGATTLVTFGGAYSNHIAATAAAAAIHNLNSIGIIRGEELNTNSNITLQTAHQHGMELKFIPREQYRDKEDPSILPAILGNLTNYFVIPEGGTNELAVKGCEEILQPSDYKYNYICCPVGTGGTMAGLIRSSANNQQVLGFSALKGSFLQESVSELAGSSDFQITDDYCFGGYGKIDADLIRFMNEFYRQNGVPLDPVYTGKMIFGIIDLIKKGHFEKNSRILAIHTGGLQGITGMNELLLKKSLPQIEY